MAEEAKQSTTQAKIIYVLYLAGFVTGITPLIGLVMAYMARSTSPSWLDTHYRFQIRTFWLGLLYGVIGVLLIVVVIGFLVLLAEAVWMIIRCVKGFQRQPLQLPLRDASLVCSSCSLRLP